MDLSSQLVAILEEFQASVVQQQNDLNGQPILEGCRVSVSNLHTTKGWVCTDCLRVRIIKPMNLTQRLILSISLLETRDLDGKDSYLEGTGIERDLFAVGAMKVCALFLWFDLCDFVCAFGDLLDFEGISSGHFCGGHIEILGSR